MKKIFFAFSLLFFCISLLHLDAAIIDVLNRFETRARQSDTSALLVSRNGKPVFLYHSGKGFDRFDCHEVSRPLLALAFGFLYDERFITNLDTPVSTFCTSWGKTEETVDVSIRTLLAQDDESFYRLGEVIEAITGEKWHDYLQIKLLTPLGIKGDCWIQEPSGRVSLCLSAPELTKIAELLIRKGEFKGEQLLSRHWVQLLHSPIGCTDPFLGLQWFLEYFDFSTYWDEALLDVYSSQGISSVTVNRLKALNGRVVHLGGLAIRGRLIHGWGHDIFCALGGQEGLTALLTETYVRRLPFGHFRKGGIKSLVAWGSGGQQLIIVPERRVIAVRQSACLSRQDTFEDLIEVLDDYIREVDCYID